MKVHHVLGTGFLESVYQKALAHELTKAGLSVAIEAPLAVHYDGVLVGNFFVDILVEDTIIIETKATQSLVTQHEVQLVNYLNALQKDTGLLLNFGTTSLQVKRKFKTYRATNPVNPVNPVKKAQPSISTTPSPNTANPVNPANPVKKPEAMQQTP